MSITKRLEEHEKLMKEMRQHLESVVKSAGLLYNHDLEITSDGTSYAIDILLAERDRLVGLLALAGETDMVGKYPPLSRS